MVPKSRKGDYSEFNIFPYNERAHSDYHFIFWNLRIDEVWEKLEEMHESIYNSEDDSITPWWLERCSLDKPSRPGQVMLFENDKQKRLQRRIPVASLQRNWRGAFDGDDIVTAREFMKVMLLFIIFGVKIADRKILFNNGHLIDFFEASPCNDLRLWAFNNCFGKSGTPQAMKSKIAKILKRHNFYKI
jgi:hypothetical protein